MLMPRVITPVPGIPPRGRIVRKPLWHPNARRCVQHVLELFFGRDFRSRPHRQGKRLVLRANPIMWPSAPRHAVAPPIERYARLRSFIGSAASSSISLAFDPDGPFSTIMDRMVDPFRRNDNTHEKSRERAPGFSAALFGLFVKPLTVASQTHRSDTSCIRRNPRGRASKRRD
jgi:hypothetical protein